MWSLPDGVVETILLGLPAFDLLRCRGVCKLWRSLISSPNFVAEHLDRSKSDPSSHHLVVRDRLSELSQQAEDLAGPFSSLICFSSVDLIIVGSVNGLICIAEESLFIPSTHEIWILNPVTGLSIHLPCSKLILTSGDQNIKLAFWCDGDGVYRVAKFVSDPDGETVRELWVSTSPNSWSVIPPFKIDFRFNHRLFHPCDVLVEGLAAYWIFVYCDDDRDDEINVVSLDFESLAMTTFVPLSNRQLDMPKGYLGNAYNGEPNPVLFGGNLNGEFVLVARNFSADAEDYNEYDVWTMGKDDDSRAPQGWIKKFSICLELCPFDTCLGIVNDKLVLASYEEGVVTLCDPLTGMLEDVEIDADLGTIMADSACGFVGSLVSIDGFEFNTIDRLHQNMCITWPYSLYPSAVPIDGWWRQDWKKQKTK